MYFYKWMMDFVLRKKVGNIDTVFSLLFIKISNDIKSLNPSCNSFHSIHIIFNPTSRNTTKWRRNMTTSLFLNASTLGGFGCPHNLLFLFCATFFHELLSIPIVYRFLRILFFNPSNFSNVWIDFYTCAGSICVNLLLTISGILFSSTSYGLMRIL